MKVSRVVLIVVALHVLVIGGIFVFEGCSRAMKSTTPDVAADESTLGQQAALPAVPGTAASTDGLTPATPTATTTTPVTAPVATTPPQPATRAYAVKRGDSLWKIAKTEGVSIAELANANNLTKTSTLQIGQKLQIPAASTTAPALETAAATSTDTGGSTYTVKSGDSLWKIAHVQNTSVSALKQANNLSGDSLKIGQKLQIPTATTSTTPTTTPTVSAGMAITSDRLAWHDPGTATENGQMIHYVDAGESPSLIAKKYGVKTAELLRVNNITDAKMVYPGERLVIPTTQPPTTVAAVTTVTPVIPASAEPAPAAPVVSAPPSSATVQ